MSISVTQRLAGLFIGIGLILALWPSSGLPVSAAPAPLPVADVTLTLDPPTPQEGHTLLIRVQAPTGAGMIGGSLGNNALTFNCCTGRQPWAVAGIEPYQSPATLPLRVIVRLADGSVRWVDQTVTVRRYPYPTQRSVYYGPRFAPGVRQTEHATLAAVFAGRSGPPLWNGPFLRPLHRAVVVNAIFGERRAFNDEPPYEVHTGVDYDAAAGTPVYAPAPGRVVWAQPLQLRGNTVIVDHGAGVFTLYAHLSAFGVRVGDRVQTGDRLALVGSTGNALGPHLHWEVHAAGSAVEPFEWVSRNWP